jgi:hypothetical protein
LDDIKKSRSTIEEIEEKSKINQTNFSKDEFKFDNDEDYHEEVGNEYI